MVLARTPHGIAPNTLGYLTTKARGIFLQAQNLCNQLVYNHPYQKCFLAENKHIFLKKKEEFFKSLSRVLREP